jgi:hypothetical protein
MKKIFPYLPLFILIWVFKAEIHAQHHHYKPPVYDEGWSDPGKQPDHVVLNLTEDPSTSMSVSWRTD